MSWDVLKDSLPFLAILIYLFLNVVLSVLASHRRKIIELHDCVKRARQIRLEYVASLSDVEDAEG